MGTLLSVQRRRAVFCGFSGESVGGAGHIRRGTELPQTAAISARQRQLDAAGGCACCSSFSWRDGERRPSSRTLLFTL